MIELKQNQLLFSFPDLHPAAEFRVELQRTLRIPDDGRDYPLPPGLGRFPMKHVDDVSERVPQSWQKRGGVLVPMYQSEALWLNFQTGYDPERGVSYPFAVKVAAGKINAVTGKPWAEGLSGAPQDYLVGGVQPWLDGYCVDKGFIRQFVAMPLGAGVSVEEQLTGEAEHGGLQLLVYPMKREIYEQRFPIRRAEETVYLCAGADPFCAPSKASKAARTRGGAAPDMGLAAGGRMRQELHEDPYELSDWQLETKSRAFVHLANSLVWRGITDEEPPTTPPTAKDYKRAGLPWFEHYSDKPALGGSKLLAGVKSVAEFIKSTGQALLPENESVTPTNIVELNKPKNPDEVREGDF